MDTFVNRNLLEDLPNPSLSRLVEDQRQMVELAGLREAHYHQDIQQEHERLMVLRNEQDRRALGQDMSWKTILTAPMPVSDLMREVWVEKCGEHLLLPGRIDPHLNQYVFECAFDLLDDNSFNLQRRAVEEALPYIVQQRDLWGRAIRRIDITLDYDTQALAQFFLGFEDTQAILYRQTPALLSCLPLSTRELAWDTAKRYLWWISTCDRDHDERASLVNDPFLFVRGKPLSWQAPPSP